MLSARCQCPRHCSYRPCHPHSGTWIHPVDVIGYLSHRYLRLYTDKAKYYVTWAYMTSHRVSDCYLRHSFVGCIPTTTSSDCHPSRSTQTPLWGVHRLLPRLKGIATGGDPKGDDRQSQSRGKVHRRGAQLPGCFQPPHSPVPDSAGRKKSVGNHRCRLSYMCRYISTLTH